MPSSPPSRRRPWVLWDVLEEHLDEATFLWTQRSRALLASDSVLSELEEDEGRLRAHLEGLALAGQPAAQRLLKPALEAEEPHRVAAAASALLHMAGGDGLQAVLDRLTGGAPESRPGLLRALELSERSDLDGQLLAFCQQAEPALRAPLLEVLAFRGVDASVVVERLPCEVEDPILLVAALRAARASPRNVAERWLRQGLKDQRPLVRNAALETGLIHGSRVAWMACRQCVERNEPEPRPALLALAIGGSPADLQRLVAAVSIPALRAEALWALGFSGRRAAAEAALSALRSEPEPLAAVAFATITGLPLDRLLQEQAPGEEEESPAEQSLPGPPPLWARPRLEVAEAWWKERRERFESNGRYWHGQPWTAELFFTALFEAPMRTRAIHAWELAIRSRGVCGLETRAWAHVQRRRLREARKVRLESAARAFEGWMTT